MSRRLPKVDSFALAIPAAARRRIRPRSVTGGHIGLQFLTRRGCIAGLLGAASSVPQYFQQGKQVLGAARFHITLHLQHDPQLLGDERKAAVFGFDALGHDFSVEEVRLLKLLAASGPAIASRTRPRASSSFAIRSCRASPASGSTVRGSILTGTFYPVWIASAPRRAATNVFTMKRVAAAAC